MNKLKSLKAERRFKWGKKYWKQFKVQYLEAKFRLHFNIVTDLNSWLWMKGRERDSQ